MPASDSYHGYIHSIETAGAVDGPGIRYVLFLSGCPLRCQYCHNPDSHKMKEGQLKTADAVIEDIAHYAPTLKMMHGGVTISGGEPLAQHQFCGEIFKRCKALGLHTALDTSGFHGTDVSDDFLSSVDLVLLDIKSGLPDIYHAVTQVELQPTLDFLERLTAIKKPVWVRFVLVPQLTDGEENIRAVAKICATHPVIERVDILPFHKMGEYKWKELGYNYALTATPSAGVEDVARAKKIFAEEGVAAN